MDEDREVKVVTSVNYYGEMIQTTSTAFELDPGSCVWIKDEWDFDGSIEDWIVDDGG